MNTSPAGPFHLAIPVDSLENARQFYGDLLGCQQGRSASTWIDWNFFGHQLVTHKGTPIGQIDHNEVDGHTVSSFHFGVIITPDQWQDLATHMAKNNVTFVMQPTTRFKGLPGEQYTFFIQDPSGNTLEFKAFENMNQLFTPD